MPNYPLHIPTAHIDVQNICHNYNILSSLSKLAQAEANMPFAKASLPAPFGYKNEQEFIWPSQLAVIKADAYGHGQFETAKALIQNGVQMFASGSVQECADIRQHFDNMVILNLLGPINEQDITLCTKLGIIPVIHSLEQMQLLNHVRTPMPIALKCNTGMARLGFEEQELNLAIEHLKQLPHITPVLALSHLHSADSLHIAEEIKTQGTRFAAMLKILREEWPFVAASLGNSAGTMFAEEIKQHIGAHICRPGIALYGANPFYGTDFASKAAGLLPAMRVSTPVLGTRKLAKGQGIGYSHTFLAKQDLQVAILACGYADGYSRGLSNKGEVCIAGKRVHLVGRVSMQMIAADISLLNDTQPKIAWLLGGPDKESLCCEELAATWGTITYEVLCILGNNVRNYTKFN